MNTLHTPGPWTVAADDLSIEAPTHPSQGTPLVAQLFVSSHIPHYQRQANARLIAAAPELLAALQTLVQMTGNAGQLERFLDTTARAVIAKATNPIP